MEQRSIKSPPMRFFSTSEGINGICLPHLGPTELKLRQDLIWEPSKPFVFPFLHFALALCHENGLFERPFCLYESAILPVPVEVGNVARSSSRH